MTSSDALSHTTKFTRDAWHRSLTTTDPSGAVTSQTLDEFGNVTQVTDALSNVTTYVYNRLDQPITETQGSFGSRSFTYDTDGNRLTSTDRNGRLIQFQYDKLYRPTSEVWKTGSTTNKTLTYTYNTIGNLTALTDSNSLGTNFNFVYDDRNQLQIERQRRIELGISTYVNLDHDYDAVGNRTKMLLNFHGQIVNSALTGGVNDLVNTYSFDGMDRLTQVTQAASGLSNSNPVAPKTAKFVYYADSQVRDMVRYANSSGAGTASSFARTIYDQAERVQSINYGTSYPPFSTWNGTGNISPSLQAYLVSAYYVSYDQANRVTGLASYKDRIQTTFTYDTRDQLTGATSAGIAGLATPAFIPPAETFGYDATGNRRSSTNQSQSSPGSHNRLQTDGTYNYQYDNEGNTTVRTEIATGKVREFTWDHRNRMTRIVDKTSAAGSITQDVRYEYDAFDRLVVKRNFNASGANTRLESRLWDHDQALMQLVDIDISQKVPPRKMLLPVAFCTDGDLNRSHIYYLLVANCIGV